MGRRNCVVPSARRVDATSGDRQIRHIVEVTGGAAPSTKGVL